MRSARRGQVNAHIDAPPHVVWALLADLEQMGQWSPECCRVGWLDGAGSPATAGARSRCWNRIRLDAVVHDLPGQDCRAGPGLAFSTIQRERELVHRRYRLEPAGGGTDLTESFQVTWLPFAARLAEDVFMRDRDRRRENAMRTTLSRIKDLAEHSARPADRPGGTALPHA